MSMSSDELTAMLSGSNLYNPQLGLAAGLLQAGGPSRLPTSLGQALGQGFTTAQQYQQAGYQNQLQRMQMALALARLQALQNAGSSTPASPSSAAVQ